MEMLFKYMVMPETFLKSSMNIIDLTLILTSFFLTNTEIGAGFGQIVSVLRSIRRKLVLLSFQPKLVDSSDQFAEEIAKSLAQSGDCLRNVETNTWRNYDDVAFVVLPCYHFRQRLGILDYLRKNENQKSQK